MRDRFSVARLTGQGTGRQKLLIVGDEQFVTTAPLTPGTIGDLSAALSAAPLRDGAGVDLDVLWDLAPAMRAIGDGTSSRPLWRYDAVVVVISTPAARVSASRWQSLLLEVIAELASSSQLVLVFADPTTRRPDGRRSRHRALQLTQQLEDAGLHLAALHTDIDPGGRLVDPAALAAGVLGLLTVTRSTITGTGREHPDPEPGRQAAVDRTMVQVHGPTAAMQRVVRLARTTFEVPFAQINLLDHGQVRTLAFAGRSSQGLRHTLAGIVVELAQPLLVGDTHAQGQYDTVEETRGPDGIRFFIGWPILSRDGYCIGAICVFDTVPHDIDPTDAALAHDIAQLAEAELLALITEFSE